MNLPQIILDFFQKNALKTTEKVVLAVSGGVDSMALLHALQQSKIRVVVAHINHGKRSASDAEASFVKNTCNALKIPFEFLRLHPEKDLPPNENFQAWARQKRYAFFAQVAKKHRAKYMATAHHADDKTETFLMNAARGSGLQGLTSLREVEQNIIRPFLNIAKTDIENWMQTHGHKWHEDESNASDDYLRNRIRHHVLPAFAEAKNNAEKGLQNTLKTLQQEQNLLQKFVENWATENVTFQNDAWHIPLAALAKIDAEPLLFYLFHKIDAHLPFAQLKAAAEAETGSYFLGKTHRALKNRNELIIEKKPSAAAQRAHISANAKKINAPLPLTFATEKCSGTWPILPQNEAAFDLDKIAFPLVLRPWQLGDKFMPLGMKGMKKVSDYLIDNKVPRTHKERTFVLLSNDKIIWLVGHRIDERFKVEQTTQKMYLARLEN